MLSLIIGLFVLGIVLIFFELIVLGGIFGIIAAVAMLGGCVLAFFEYGAAGGILTFLIFSVLTVGCLVIELKFLPKTRVGRRFFLKGSIEGTSQKPVGEKDLVGKECETLTTLSPTGLVRIDGMQYEAFSQSGLVNRGTRMKVVDVDNFRVKVSKL